MLKKISLLLFLFVCFLSYAQKKETITKIKLSNATLLKTNDDKRFKLIYAKGMKYRMVYLKEDPDDLNSMDKIIAAQISPDGANTNTGKDVVIELWDTQTNKRILKNVFVYSEQ